MMEQRTGTIIVFLVFVLVLPLAHAGNYGAGPYGGGVFGIGYVGAAVGGPKAAGASGPAGPPGPPAPASPAASTTSVSFDIGVTSFESSQGKLFDIRFSLEDSWVETSDELEAVVTFENFGALGGFFDFDYFVKGVGEINNDVTVDFWIEEDGKIIVSGSDVIYMRSSEEKAMSGKLLLPSKLTSGLYQFFIQVSYGESSAISHRTVELRQMEPTSVDLTFIILDKDGNTVYTEKDSIIVETEEVLRKSVPGLNLSDGKYTFVLQTVYGVNIFDEFKQKFRIGSIKPKEYFMYTLSGLAAFIFILLLFGVLMLRKKRVPKHHIVHRQRRVVAKRTHTFLGSWMHFCFAMIRRFMKSHFFLTTIRHFMKFSLSFTKYFFYGVIVLVRLLIFIAEALLYEFGILLHKIGALFFTASKRFSRWQEQRKIWGKRRQTTNTFSRSLASLCLYIARDIYEFSSYLAKLSLTIMRSTYKFSQTLINEHLQSATLFKKREKHHLRQLTIREAICRDIQQGVKNKKASIIQALQEQHKLGDEKM